MQTFIITTNDFYDLATFCKDGKFRINAPGGTESWCVKSYKKYGNAVKVGKRLINRKFVKSINIVPY